MAPRPPDARYPLPPSLREIARVIGEHAALELALRFGGARLNIPIRPAPDSDLVAAIGLSAATALSAEFAAVQRILVPLAKRALILWMRDRGRSVRQIALACKVTERTVYNTLSPGADPRQPDFFCPAAW